MKKFLYHILWLFTVLIALNFLIYALLSYRVDSRFNNYYKLFDSIEAKEYDLLLTGDSHAEACWRTIDKENILNLTFPGDNYIDINRKLIYLKNAGITFKNHLIEVDQHLLNDYRAKTNNNDLSIHLTKSTFFISIQKYLPLFFNSNLKNELIIALSFTSETGSEDSQDAGLTKKSIRNRAKTQFFEVNFNHSMFEELKVVTEKTIAQGGQSFFLSYPLYSEYRLAIDTTEAYKTSSKFLMNYIEEFEIIYFDTQNLFCDQQWFFNQDHINQEAAKKAQNFYISILENPKSNMDFNCIDAIDFP
jgi:hypothetical protein